MMFGFGFGWMWLALALRGLNLPVPPVFMAVGTIMGGPSLDVVVMRALWVCVWIGFGF